MDNNYSGGFKLDPATVGDPNQEVKKVIDRYAGPLHKVSCGFLLLAVCTTVVGCLNLYFARDNLKWPFSSGSGIWCGVMFAVSSIVGIVLWKSDFTKDIKRWKRLFGAHYGLTIANISLGVQHIVYSAMSLQQCATQTGTCSAQAQQSVIISYAFSTAFGLGIVIGTVTLTVLNVKVRNHVRRRTPLC